MPEQTNAKNVRRCPICKAESVAAYQPFCSKRCADVDLGKWFNNSYAIPSDPSDDEAENPVKSSEAEDDRGS